MPASAGITRLYPNPATDHVSIQTGSSEPVKLTVMNVMGEVVYEDNVQDQLQLNTAAWASGTYLVRCGNAVSKLMITK